MSRNFVSDEFLCQANIWEVSVAHDVSGVCSK